MQVIGFLFIYFGDLGQGGYGLTIINYGLAIINYILIRLIINKLHVIYRLWMKLIVVDGLHPFWMKHEISSTKLIYDDDVDDVDECL